MDFVLRNAKATDEGIVEGFASTYGNTDRHNERVMPNAFTKTLEENGNRVPLLWQHKQDEPVGLASVYDQPLGLSIRALLDMDSDIGRRAFSSVKKGIVGAFSIGFDVIKARRAKDGIREITEIRLWEVSLVTFPANPAAVVTGVKADMDMSALRDLRRLLKDASTLAEADQGERQLLAAMRAFRRSADRFITGRPHSTT